MGRRSAGRRRDPEHIDRLDPATESRETRDEAARRRGREGYRNLKRRAERRRRILLGCVGATALALLVAAVTVAVYLNGVEWLLHRGIRQNEGIIKALTPSNRSVPRTVTQPFWMVVVGVDAREGEDASRSDTILLTHIDPDRKRVAVVSIPRDTRVRIEGHGTNKINTALFYEGPEGLIKAIKSLTGAQVTHYVAVDFNGFKEIVDAMGGVWLDVPELIVDKKAANYDPKSYVVEPGMQKLDGAHALTFVRSRNFPEGDIARIRNQQLFLRAMAKQMLKLGNVFKAKGIIDAVARNAETDLKITDMMSLVSDLMKMEERSVETVTLPGEPKYVGAVSYVVPDDEAIEELVARIEAGGSVMSTAAADATGTVKPSMVTVTVRNGVGVAGIAAECAGVLEKAGFRISEIGNAGQFVYERTLVVYSKDKRKAAAVRDSLGTGDLVESRGMYAFNTDVLVVVGRDWRSSASGTRDGD